MAEKRSRRWSVSLAVKRLMDAGRGPSEVATELGLSTGQLTAWRTQPLAAGLAKALELRKLEETPRRRRVETAGGGKPGPAQGRGGFRQEGRPGRG
jgi:transposase